MNRLPEVKTFIFQDVPLFHDVLFKPLGGAPPVLQFLNQAGDIVEKVDLSEMNREQCNEELKKRGFYKKSSHDEEISSEILSNLKYGLKEEL